ncbi:hypothetical protein E1180_12275 [Roseibium denhamense]|uniref:Cysteine rich repeat-containing protein n=1 Tax=Roseibium denhamense TaxID=76305 RepID=A0ABY1PF36_9HYPH|nr:cysteine rich repeat-containing protein [Roseibium denhamense]MTI06291.1 hypothetical protein [Roseibium denhamense]SMP33053.1 Cysteine rich repeat-containing protein [Roseibium denhamense]
MVRFLRFAAVIIAAGLLTSAGSVGPAHSNAFMAACKTDLETLCSGVKEGRGRLSACLFAHDTKVSGTCKPELAKVTSSATFKKMLPASLNSLQGSDRAAKLQQVCGTDIKAQCQSAGSGTERVLACLYARSNSISKPCYAEAESILEGR